MILVASDKPYLMVIEFQVKKGDTLRTQDQSFRYQLMSPRDVPASVLLSNSSTVESHPTSGFTQLGRGGKMALTVEILRDLWWSREARGTVKGNRADYMWTTLEATCNDK